MIRVAGIDVRLAALTQLALELHNAADHGLASRIDRAVDGGADEIQLQEREYAELLVAIERHPVEGLDELRAHLLERLRDSN